MKHITLAALLGSTLLASPALAAADVYLGPNLGTMQTLVETALQPSAVGSTVAGFGDTRITGAAQANAVGAISGIAPLDANKFLPTANLPAIPIGNLPTASSASCSTSASTLATPAYVASCAPTSTSSGSSGDSAITAQSAGYTVSSSDCNTTIRDTGTTSHNYTVPSGLPLKCSIHILQAGASTTSTPGLLTAVAGSGETLEAYAGQSSTAGQFAFMNIYIDTASTFVVSGNR